MATIVSNTACGMCGGITHVTFTNPVDFSRLTGRNFTGRSKLQAAFGKIFKAMLTTWFQNMEPAKKSNYIIVIGRDSDAELADFIITIVEPTIHADDGRVFSIQIPCLCKMRQLQSSEGLPPTYCPN